MNLLLIAVYYNNHDVRIEEVPIPQIGEDEALFKVMASGICGSDVIEWYRVPKAPKVLGHEATGVIEKVGSKVSSLRLATEFLFLIMYLVTMSLLQKRLPHSLPHIAHNKLFSRRLLTVH